MSRLLPLGLLLMLAAAACTRAKPEAPGRPPSPGVLQVREGLASYYGARFDGKTTASGARFDMHAMVAAHPSWPFGTIVRVTNLDNGRSVDVRVLDRGPASGPQARGVIIDVSYGAARALGFVREGLARVRLEVLRWGSRERR